VDGLRAPGVKRWRPFPWTHPDAVEKPKGQLIRGYGRSRPQKPILEGWYMRKGWTPGASCASKPGFGAQILLRARPFTRSRCAHFG
jgi:hypothetical protein